MMKTSTHKERTNLRRRNTLQKMVENGGNMTVSGAMRDAGYSEAYIHSNKIKDTKGWADLIDEALSDRVLMDKHLQLLNKEEIVIRRNKQERTGQPHSDVKYALNMAYKLKKKYGDTTIKHEFAHLTDEELEVELGETLAVIVAGAIDLMEKERIQTRSPGVPHSS